jgi:hypothetical protein
MIKESEETVSSETKRKRNKMTNLKMLKVETVKYADITAPKKVEEFRENLKRFFMSYGDDALYVKTRLGECIGVPYTELNSISDLYAKCGWGASITPLVHYSMDDVAEFMERTGQYRSCDGFFPDADAKSKLKIWDGTKLQRTQLFDLPLSWFSIDNQILAEFLIHVLGAFSGYEVNEEEVA